MRMYKYLSKLTDSISSHILARHAVALPEKRDLFCFILDAGETKKSC